MTTTTAVRLSLAAMVLAILAACSAQESPPPKPKVVKRDLLVEIRSQAEALASSVQVEPLADPEVDDLRARARSEEMKGQYESAAAAIAQALALRPEDPTLIQWAAELALVRGQYVEAERDAQRSYELGPRLGEICVRNWLTIKEARGARNDAQGAGSAAAQLPACQVQAPVRM